MFQDIVKLLSHAGQAIKALTQEPAAAIDVGYTDFEDRRARFASAAGAYFDTLSSIDVNLRRHILDLKKKDIIPTDEYLDGESPDTGESSRGDALSPPSTRPKSLRKNAITAGGLGNLDIGWLNSRNDKVGKDTSASLWQEAFQLVQKCEDAKESPNQHVERSPGENSESPTEAMDQS